MHQTPPNTRIRLALILLVGVVACLIAFYSTYEPNPRAIPRDPTPPPWASSSAFREQMYGLWLRNEPEHQTTENAAAIAAIGLELMRELKRSQPRRSVEFGWESVQLVRSIHGDVSLETNIVLEQFLKRRNWPVYASIDPEYLVPILDQAHELAEAQEPTGLWDLDARQALCTWLGNFAADSKFLVGNLIEGGGLDKAAERLEYARIILDRPWHGSLCEFSEFGSLEFALKQLADAEAALDAARAEEGD